MIGKRQVRYYGQKTLPIIQYVETLFPKDHLKNVYLLACQHVLPSTHMMIRSMTNLGLDRSNIAVIGKCYSTNNQVMKDMNNEGIYVCNSSNKFDSDLSFDEQFRKSIDSFIETQIARMCPSKDSTIVILDDGGELITAAQHLIHSYPNIIGVEQTSSGYHKLASMNLNFPVKNIALLNAKLVFETPLIAKSLLENLEKKLSLSTSEGQDILVAGNGYVGRGVYNMLTNYKQHKVVTYDIIQEKSEINYLDFSKFDLIISATGTKMMSRHYYESLKSNATLVNVASSDREFDAVYFRKLSGKKWGIHDDVYYKDLRLLNCGFPLNFSGEKVTSVPLKKIQLVCALLFLGVCEFKDYFEDNKFISLNKETVNSIIHRFSLMNYNDVHDIKNKLLYFKQYSKAS